MEETIRLVKENNPYFSARIIYPYILKYTGKVNSVVDVGCGLGGWLRVFEEMGTEKILGIDLKVPEKLVISEVDFISKDLEEPIKLNERFDLALSLEVAEHLSKNRAESFIDDLTGLSDKVLFSAAIPLQGGRDHINEQFPDYWIDKFEKRNYAVIDFRDEIRWFFYPCWWYAQNMLLFVKKGTDKFERKPPFIYMSQALKKRYLELIENET